MHYIHIIGEQLPYGEVVVGHMTIVSVSAVNSRANNPLNDLRFLSPGPTLLCIALLSRFRDVPEGSRLTIMQLLLSSTSFYDSRSRGAKIVALSLDFFILRSMPLYLSSEYLPRLKKLSSPPMVLHICT